jgi:hypothetical protein
MEGKGTTAGLAASSVRLGRGRPGLKWARRPTRGLKLFCGVPTSSVHVENFGIIKHGRVGFVGTETLARVSII